MAKEFFKDLPNTTTPLTASRLNGLLDGEESMGNLVVDSIRTKNMFDKDSAIYRHRLSNDGGLYSDSNYFTSDFIEIKSSTQYTISRENANPDGYCAYALYDSSKTFISRSNFITTTSSTFTTTSTAKYIRIDDLNNNINSLQLEEGSIATTYTPHQNLNPKEPAIVYYGSLQGGASVTLTDVRRYLKIYFSYKDTQTITYEIDTSKTGSSNLVYGSGVGIAYDESGGLDYYISESSFDKSNNSFSHTRTGYFKLPNTYASRNSNNGYIIYRIDTYD